MFEIIGIFGDVIRIATFQPTHNAARHEFARHEPRPSDRKKVKRVSVPQIGRQAVALKAGW